MQRGYAMYGAVGGPVPGARGGARKYCGVDGCFAFRESRRKFPRRGLWGALAVRAGCTAGRMLGAPLAQRRNEPLATRDQNAAWSAEPLLMQGARRIGAVATGARYKTCRVFVCGTC